MPRGQGQRAATLLGILLLLGSSLVTLWLARRWFPLRDGRRAALLFVWSGGAILATVLPGPGLLLALLGALLYATLVPLDVRMSSKRAPLSLAIIAGARAALMLSPRNARSDSASRLFTSRARSASALGACGI